MTLQNRIELLLNRMEVEADNLANDAAMSGSWSDNGASRLRDNIEMYRHGMNGTVPPDWEKFMKDIDNQADPEYKKFLELKKRFEE